MILTIELVDTYEGETIARLKTPNSPYTLVETRPNKSPSIALKHLAQLISEMPTDVLYATTNNAPLDRKHPRVKRILEG